MATLEQTPNLPALGLFALTGKVALVTGATRGSSLSTLKCGPAIYPT